MAGPHILTDYRFREGPVYFRYGAFLQMWFSTEQGTRIPGMDSPDGMVADERLPVPSVPEWVEVPPVLRTSVDAYESTDGEVELPFTPDAGLHFSNGGGVYSGTLHDLDAEAVIKEGRPHAGLDGLGRDAVTRLAAEASALRALAGIPGVPALYAEFDCWEHHFVAMERFHGRTLSQFVASTAPAVNVTSGAAARAEYADRVRRIFDELADIVGQIHERGYVFGDLQPENILIAEDDRVLLVDFEASRPASDQKMALGTPGFIGPMLRPVANDLFALARLELFAHIPLVAVLDLTPRLEETHIEFAGLLYGTAVADRLRQRRDRAHDPDYPVSSVFAPLPSDQSPTHTAKGIIRGVLRTRNLLAREFPGDVEQFQYAGAWNLHTGSAGVRWALAEHGTHLPPLPELLERGRDAGPGLLSGGLGMALLPLLTDGRSPLDLVLELMVDRRDHTLVSGLAGDVLALATVQRRTGWDLEEAATPVIRRLVDLVAQPPLEGLQAGLLRGYTGPALALCQAAHTWQRPDLVEWAREAYELDFAECAPYTDGSLQVRDGARLLPYLGWGALGVALAGQALLHEGHEDLREQVRQLAVPLAAPTFYCAGLFHGRAGFLVGTQLLDDDVLPLPRPQLLKQHLDGLRLHLVRQGDAVHVPGNLNFRFSTDYATGSAGVLAALAPLLHGGSWFPLDLPLPLLRGSSADADGVPTLKTTSEGGEFLCVPS